MSDCLDCIETSDDLTHLPKVLDCDLPQCQDCITLQVVKARKELCIFCNQASTTNDELTPINRDLLDFIVSTKPTND